MNNEIYIILPVFCLSVWHSIDSAPGPDTDLIPVSLEPDWSEPNILGTNFPENLSVAKLPIEKNMPPMLFYWKNWAQFVFMFETQSYCESKVPNAGVTLL